ncbi:Hpt domain-containing protein [Dyadobacter sp. CY326]|uniref:Hpt domain-containing protein n=1 Tax=Dyadobacter sp. CY326 TaxID=2907300 RepID=UPI001F42878B|nr:Hpt domain-containing protein [Dyadobacter sp. CY326]MCE7066059.1 Hpt domain-containing protein [Dyadobacter sp. CY326]
MDLQLNPALDLNYIDQVYGDDPVILYMIFDAFLSDSVPRWHSLHTALKTKDMQEAASIVHGLKPSFTMAGLTWIRPKVEVLEKAIKEKESPEALMEIYQRISAELNELLPIIEQESERLKLI